MKTLDGVHIVIADAVRQHIGSHIKQDNARRFFRLYGFDEQTYIEFLRPFTTNGESLEGQPIWIRTTNPIAAHGSYALEADKSPTWYRNHLPRGHTLVLIANSDTTDSQSLKDIYSITEKTLTTLGLNRLVNAAEEHSDYQLEQQRRDLIVRFIERFKSTLFEPQLRHLAEFLISVTRMMADDTSIDVVGAMSVSLPYLSLFAASEFAHVFNKPQGDTLLRDNLRAAKLGIRTLDNTELDHYLAALDQADFDDDSAHNGLSSAEKRECLRSFLQNVVSDREGRLEVLTIDWREVSPVLHKRKIKTKLEKRQELARSLQDALDDQVDLSENAERTIQEIDAGHELSRSDIENLLDEIGVFLPKDLSNAVKRLQPSIKWKTEDFVSGLVQVTVDLAQLAEKEQSQAKYKISVRFAGDQGERISSKRAAALAVFSTLYGGIQQWMPSVCWELNDFWEYAQSNASILGDDEEEDEQREKILTDTLTFKVSITAKNSKKTLASADLIWVYRSDSPNALTALHVSTLHGMKQESPLKIPVYDTCEAHNVIADLDLSRPIASFGTWYRSSTDLYATLSELAAPRLASDEWHNITNAFRKIERSWNDFIEIAGKEGLYAASIPQFCEAYQQWLSVIIDNLKHSEPIRYVFRELVRAWVVGKLAFDDWAVVPLLHPIKLQWLISRVKQFDKFVQRIVSHVTEECIIDENRFKKELEIAFNSSLSPAILALPGQDKQVRYFLPVNESQGYELFRHIDKASIAYGLDPELVTDVESAEAVQSAARDITRVIRNYVETYPYVRDGLEIYIVECRDGSFPGLLVKRLDGISQKRNWNLRINVIVHTSDRGAPLFRRVSEWIQANEEFAEKMQGRYFPMVTLKVLECGFQALFDQVDDTDIVVLADVLAVKGQVVGYDFATVDSRQRQSSEFISLSRNILRPFERREMFRKIDLVSLEGASELSRNFYYAQWAAHEGRYCDRATKEYVKFYLKVSLSTWEQYLERLHEKFNWVVCYDPIVDRFLLKATCKEAVQIIRYSLGLGPKRRHNMTVSSSKRSQDIVVRRLTNKLRWLLPGTENDFRNKVAIQLVEEAKSLSGDIVLRAAGPGTYLNELIGMVVAKTRTESRYRELCPDALTAWIYLDDFAHWFDSGQFPDLLFVAFPPSGAKEYPLVHIEVIETKCVSETIFAAESKNAQSQVVRGLNRLARVWQPETQHLDTFYWYDQFRLAIVGNLDVVPEQNSQLVTYLDKFSAGEFERDISGHSWVVCYDGDVGIQNGSVEGNAKSSNLANAPHTYHHMGRSSLRSCLRYLVQDKWEMKVPDSVWKEPTEIAVKELPAPQNYEYDVDDFKSSNTVDTNGEVEESIPSLLDKDLSEWITSKAKLLTRSLRDYEVNARTVDPEYADIGSSIVRLKVELRPGEKLSRVQGIAVDLQRSLELDTVPIVENVSGTRFIGVDLPHPNPEAVSLFEFLPTFNEAKSDGYISFQIGITPDGEIRSADFKDLKHLLVSGSTGSGKTIFLYSLMVSLLYRFRQYELSILIIDPKQTDFVFFDDIPHLRGARIVIEPEEAVQELVNLTELELPARTQQLRDARCRDIQEYNTKFPISPLVPIVVVIDEYADLVQVLNKKDREKFEGQMTRLAQRARNVGIHLVVTTQRPSSDIVTSKLKANLPARFAFRLPSYHDSMTILGKKGAENLLGKGDMLFESEGTIERLQGFYVETDKLQAFLENIL